MVFLTNLSCPIGHGTHRAMHHLDHTEHGKRAHVDARGERDFPKLYKIEFFENREHEKSGMVGERDAVSRVDEFDVDGLYVERGSRGNDHEID